MRLLATDLDGTFLGDEASTLQLWRELDDAGITVAFSTGRHLDSILGLYRELGTSRRATTCICMVGTEIWERHDDGYRPDRSWWEAIGSGWDRAAVDTLVGRISGVRSQPGEWQSQFKVSFYLDRPPDAGVDDIRNVLERAGLRCRVVYSGGRYLDILPEGAGKGAAVAWVAEHSGLSREDVVVAGDSGNDLDMMTPELGFRSIVVGNASPELRQHDGPRVYHATATHASGVREGLVHLGWLEA